MQVTVDKRLIDNRYNVTVSTSDFSAQDDALIDSFGDPIVEAGGTFTDGGSVTFTLPADPRKMKAEFVAVKQVFDGDDYADAEQRANLWATEMLVRLQAAIVELRTNIDGFTGITITTL